MSVEELKYFFSYARRNDSEFVLKLAKELRAVGANLWLDQLDIPGGRFWDREIEKALKTCQGMIAVLSPDSVASDNVMNEVSYALDEGKLVVPILIHSCDIPLCLRRVQYIDFTADYDKGFSQLLRAMGIEQPVQPVEPVATQEPVVQEPSLPKQPELAPDALDHPKPTGVETEKAPRMSQKVKVLAAICTITLIAIVSIGVFLKYLQPKTYSLNRGTPAVGGYITKSPDRISYNHGETVTVEAAPNEGYRFTNWSGDLSGSDNPTTLVMDANKSVTASFVLVETNSIGMKLVYIPAGSFMMGSGDSTEQLAREYDEHPGIFTDEIPQHQVRISKGFWMGQTEVTQGQYKSVMNAEPWSGKSFVQEDANNPAVYVTWENAAAFCRKLSQKEGKTYRLPTEAEWEYACRAGATTRFSFGDDSSSLGEYAWCRSNASNHASPVGQKRPNPWGLYDVHGNVSEWCSDWYGRYYYSNSPSVDPNGPPTGTCRSLRGGSWNNSAVYHRCSYRNSDVPDDSSEINLSGGILTGFRVVRSQ